MHSSSDETGGDVDRVPDTGSAEVARGWLRDAIDRDGPEALAPAALGCLIVDLECLVDVAAQLEQTVGPSVAPLVDYLRVALGHVGAYRALVEDLRERLTPKTSRSPEAGS